MNKVYITRYDPGAIGMFVWHEVEIRDGYATELISWGNGSIRICVN